MYVVEILVHSHIRFATGLIERWKVSLHPASWVWLLFFLFTIRSINGKYNTHLSHVMNLLSVCFYSRHFEMGIAIYVFFFYKKSIYWFKLKIALLFEKRVLIVSTVAIFYGIKNKWTRWFLFQFHYRLCVMWLMDIEFECSGLCHERNGFFFCFLLFIPNETNRNELFC